MKDVTVYRCGTIIADGVELQHVTDIDVPITSGDKTSMPRISMDITGTLTFSPDKYVIPEPVPVPIHPDTSRLDKVRMEVLSMVRAKDISESVFQRLAHIAN